MYDYCFYDENSMSYVCDWHIGTNKKVYYYSYHTCYKKCSPLTYDNDLVPVSKAQLVQDGAIFGILLGAIILFGIIKSIT